jgi:hypothetical protein
MKSKSMKEIKPESGENVSDFRFSGESESDVHVRQLAEYFYRGRLERDEPGTPEEDWYRAEQLLATIEE